MEKESNRIAAIVVISLSVILLLGFWFIPYEVLAQISGIMGVVLPTAAKAYQEFKRLAPKFELDVDGAKDITVTIPRHVGRISVKVKNCNHVTIEGAGDDISIERKKDE